MQAVSAPPVAYPGVPPGGRGAPGAPPGAPMMMGRGAPPGLHIDYSLPLTFLF